MTRLEEIADLEKRLAALKGEERREELDLVFSRLRALVETAGNADVYTVHAGGKRWALCVR